MSAADPVRPDRHDPARSPATAASDLSRLDARHPFAVGASRPLAGAPRHRARRQDRQR